MLRWFPFLLIAAVVGGCYEEHKPPRETYVPKLHAQELNNLAMSALRAEKYDEALSLVSQAVEDDPRFYQAQINKANILGKIGRFEEAVSVLTQAIAVKPDFAQAYLFQGVYLEKTNKKLEAQASYARAAELFARDMNETPLPETALCKAIAVYLGTGKVGGVTALNETIARYPDYVPARFLREKVLKGDRDYFMWWLAEQNNRPVPGKQE